MKCTKLADVSQSLNINSPVFALSQLQRPKLFVRSETHVDVVALVVRVVISMVFVMHESSSVISHKIVSYVLLLL